MLHSLSGLSLPLQAPLELELERPKVLHHPEMSLPHSPCLRLADHEAMYPRELSPDLLADLVLANMALLPKVHEVDYSEQQQEAAGQPGTLLASVLQLNNQSRPEHKESCQRQQLLRLLCFLPSQDQDMTNQFGRRVEGEMTANHRQSPLCPSFRAQDPGYQPLPADDKGDGLSAKPSLKNVWLSAAADAGPAVDPGMERAMLSLLQPLKRLAAVAGLAMLRQHQCSDKMPPGVCVPDIQQGCQPLMVNGLESKWQAGTGGLQQAAQQQQLNASSTAPEIEIDMDNGKTATQLGYAARQVTVKISGSDAAAIVEPMQPFSNVDPVLPCLGYDEDDRQTSAAEHRARHCLNIIGDRASTHCIESTARGKRRPAEEIKTNAPTQPQLRDSKGKGKLNRMQAGSCPWLCQDAPGSMENGASAVHCIPRRGSRQACSRDSHLSGTPANGARWAAEEKRSLAPMLPYQTGTRKGTAKGIACKREQAPGRKPPWIAPDQAMAAAKVALLWKEPAAKHTHARNALLPVRSASPAFAKVRAAPAEASPLSGEANCKMGRLAMHKQMQAGKVSDADSPAPVQDHQTYTDRRPKCKAIGASVGSPLPAGLSGPATHTSQGSADMELQGPKMLPACASYSGARSGLQVTAKPFNPNNKARPAANRFAARRPTDVSSPGREQSHACPGGVHRKSSAPRHPNSCLKPGQADQRAQRTAATDASHGQWRTALMSKPASSSSHGPQVCAVAFPQIGRMQPSNAAGKIHGVWSRRYLAGSKAQNAVQQPADSQSDPEKQEGWPHLGTDPWPPCAARPCGVWNADPPARVQGTCGSCMHDQKPRDIQLTEPHELHTAVPSPKALSRGERSSDKQTFAGQECGTQLRGEPYNSSDVAWIGVDEVQQDMWAKQGIGKWATPRPIRAAPECQAATARIKGAEEPPEDPEQAWPPMSFPLLALPDELLESVLVMASEGSSAASATLCQVCHAFKDVITRVPDAWRSLRNSNRWALQGVTTQGLRDALAARPQILQLSCLAGNMQLLQPKSCEVLSRMTSLSLSADDTPCTPSLKRLLAAVGSLPHLCTLKLLHGKPCCERAALGFSVVRRRELDVGLLLDCGQLRSLAILGDVGDELVLTGLDSLTCLHHLSLAANVSPAKMPVLDAAWPPGLLSLDLHCYKLAPNGAARACSGVLHDLARSIPTFSCWLKFNCQQPDRNLPQEFAEQLFALRSDICVVYKPHMMKVWWTPLDVLRAPRERTAIRAKLRQKRKVKMSTQGALAVFTESARGRPSAYSAWSLGPPAHIFEYPS